MKKSAAFLTLVLMLMTSGCQTYLDETQAGGLGGAALGAGLGAIIGNQTGHAGAGTAIGAGAGALAGALAGEGIKRAGQRNANAYQNQYPAQAQSYAAPQPVQEAHTKYNPITGKTFPESFRFDPDDGTELKYIR